ncbi:MAG: sulfurtransferase [Gammaproteobacteria bacterium]|nr:sulfurtransferase [Gammaproteobacteria bacterium]
MSWLINSAQLDKFRKNQKNVILFDASFHMPDEQRDAKTEFLTQHIAGAQFFSIDDFSDPDPAAPHTHMLLQDEKILSEKLSALGVRNDAKIIFYDNSKLHTACRALWMFKMFGHNPQLLYVLDGGLDSWNKYNGKTESGEPHITARPYKVNFKNEFIRTLSQMKSNLHNPSEQVIDARHAVRFAGGPETSPNLRLGHIPGSFSFPYNTLFEKDGLWRPIEKIKSQLIACGIDLKTPIITTCGTAMTAATLDFVLDLLEHPNHAIYNGSWSEWGSQKLYPNELSLDERPVEDCLTEK